MPSHWYILGAGSIGCLFAGALHRTGSDCTLVGRNKTDSETGPEGEVQLKITEQGNTWDFVTPVSLADETSPISHLLVTTKAYDVRRAVASVAHRLDKHSQILLLVNGMGILEELEADHPHLVFFCGTTTEGAYRTGAGEVTHAGRGTTRIGAARNSKANPPAWFTQWADLSLVCTWEPDIQAAMWQKLAVNCAINPLTAIHRCNNGDLLQREDLAGELVVLCDEIAAVCAAAGQPGIAETLHQTVRDVVRGTADNRSSMLQDVLARRPTEIAYISGYLVSVARQLGLSTPVSEQLLADIEKIAL